MPNEETEVERLIKLLIENKLKTQNEKTANDKTEVELLQERILKARAGADKFIEDCHRHFAEIQKKHFGE